MNVLVIGGNRFFGKHLVKLLLEKKCDVTLLNRGNLDDGFGNRVSRLKIDRTDRNALEQGTKGYSWDLIFDQVCYTADQAQVACEILSEKTKRFVVTSSESIYDGETCLKESDFAPASYQFVQAADPNIDYKAAKRQVETIYTTHSSVPLALVRMSLVIGVDDYTARLKWHLDRIMNQVPIYFPNMDARLDFIKSDQAGLAMAKIGMSNHQGPINCSSSGPLKIRDLVEIMETACGKKAVLAASGEQENHSPYGVEHDRYMDTTQLNRIGFAGCEGQEWIRQLIFEIQNERSQSSLETSGVF